MRVLQTGLGSLPGDDPNSDCPNTPVCCLGNPQLAYLLVHDSRRLRRRDRLEAGDRQEGQGRDLLRCPVQASGSCKGTLSLKTAKKVKLGPAKKGFLALGNATFSIPAGLTVKVPVKISQAGLKRLKKRKSLAASATVVAHDGLGQLKTTSGKLQLKRAKKKH